MAAATTPQASSSYDPPLYTTEHLVEDAADSMVVRLVARKGQARLGAIVVQQAVDLPCRFSDYCENGGTCVNTLIQVNSTQNTNTDYIVVDNSTLVATCDCPPNTIEPLCKTPHNMENTQGKDVQRMGIPEAWCWVPK